MFSTLQQKFVDAVRLGIKVYPSMTEEEIDNLLENYYRLTNSIDGYQKIKKIGEGAFGDVFLANKLYDGKLYAIKNLKNLTDRTQLTNLKGGIDSQENTAMSS